MREESGRERGRKIEKLDQRNPQIPHRRGGDPPTLLPRGEKREAKTTDRDNK